MRPIRGFKKRNRTEGQVDKDVLVAAAALSSLQPQQQPLDRCTKKINVPKSSSQISRKLKLPISENVLSVGCSDMGKKAVLRSAKKVSGKGISDETKKSGADSSKRRDFPSPASVNLKSKRRKILFDEPVVQETKDWDYLIRAEDYFTAKIGSHIGDEVVGNLKSNLSKSQLGLFRKTCFGHFLDLPDFKFQAQLVHCLLLRELKQPIDNELWIGVQGCCLRFSIEEFAVVTGLNCIGDCNKLSFAKESNRLILKYFGRVKKINKQSIEELFLSRRWDSDEDALKIAVLYFIHLFLLSSPKEKIISKDDLDIVDSGCYNDYPWGKEVFYVTLESLKHKLHGKQNRGAPTFYRLIGFPLAFQVWFFECCPYVVGKLAVLVGDSIPRILNWSSSSNSSYKILHNGLFSESAKKLKLKNITPTIAERRELKLDKFFGKGKRDAFVVEDGKSDSEDDDDQDDDFESYGPPKKAAASTSKQPERSRFDSDGSSFEVEEMRKKLKKVSSRQKKLSKDFSSLKRFLEKKFAEVFDSFSVLQSKLQTDHTSVGCKDFEVVDDNDKKETEKDSDDEEDEDEINYGDDNEDDEEDNGGDSGGGVGVGVGVDVDGEGDDEVGRVDF